MRHMCIGDDFSGQEGSSLIKCATFFLVSSTWLVIQELEEIEAFISWKHGRSSISSQEYVKESLDEMHGLLTKESMPKLVQDILKSMEAPMLAFLQGGSSVIISTSSSHRISPLTMSLPCDKLNVGKVEDVDVSKYSEV